MSKKNAVWVVLLVFAVVLLGSGLAASNHITIFMDGKVVESEVSPQVVDGRTMVPIRLIAENFGAEVRWQQEQMAVEITSPYGKFIEGYNSQGMYIKQAGEVLAMVQAGSAVVLDVRSDRYRSQSYITDSIHIPVERLLDGIGELPQDKAIAVYCVKNINAAYAVAMLTMMGYEAYVLENGMDAWAAAGGQNTICSR